MQEQAFKGQVMKKIRFLVAVISVSLLCGLGYQIYTINKNYQDRIENSYTPAGIVDESRNFFSTDGSLVLPEQPVMVTIQPGDTALAAYRYSKLLQDKFPDLLMQDQLGALTDIANDNQQPNLVRLYAYAALKRAGAGYNQQASSDLASEAMGSFPATINQDNVSSYMDIAEVALDINPDLTRKSLKEFTVGESQERLTVAILAQTYLFANEADVKIMFADTRGKLEAWVFNKDAVDTPDRYLLSSLAYINLNNLSSEQRQYLRDQDQTLARCEKSPSYIAVDVQGQQICSLLLTEIYYQRGIDHD